LYGKLKGAEASQSYSTAGLPIDHTLAVGVIFWFALVPMRVEKKIAFVLACLARMHAVKPSRKQNKKNQDKNNSGRNGHTLSPSVCFMSVCLRSVYMLKAL